MNESPWFISNTYIIPHNLIALANKFTKKFKRSYSNLKNDKQPVHKKDTIM